jgi:uncharacterized protein YkwD
MKRVSLANLAANAPPPHATEPVKGAKARRTVNTVSSEKGNKITSDEDKTGEQRVQVAFRMDKDAYKELKRQALDEDTTINELIVEAINQLRAQKGLKKLSA